MYLLYEALESPNLFSEYVCLNASYDSLVYWYSYLSYAILVLFSVN